MAKSDDGVLPPETEIEALERAVRRALGAAQDLLTAADLAEEGVCVDDYINAAIRLRDLASFLSPNKPDWPTEGAKIYDLKTRKQMN